MYNFYINDKLLHDDTIDNLKIFSPKIELQQNTIGSFEFTVYPTNPYIDEIREITAIVKVYQGSDLIFRGRAIEIDKCTKNSLKVYCECERAFLCDSIQEPYEYNGSIDNFLKMIIDNHNKQVDTAKQFKLGKITVTDPNNYIIRSDTQWLNTWNTIQEKLIKLLGGYINIRHEEDGIYIDYLDDFTTLNNQIIQFGENLLKVDRKNDSRDVYTVLYPLGKKDDETGEQLNIASINDGKKYIESAEGIKKYGRISKMLSWDDVTVAENLKTKAEQTLSEALYSLESIEINAVDIASVGKDITNFKMNAKIHVISQYHDIDDFFVPIKMTFYPFSQSNNKITLNSTKKSLTDATTSTSNNYGNVVEKVENIINNSTLNIPSQIAGQVGALRQELTTLIEQTSSSILSQVNENYFEIGDNEIINQLQTTLEQTKSYFEFTFNEFNSNLESAINGTNEEFSQLTQYIRLENGAMIISDNSGDFKAKFSKEGIILYQGNYEALALNYSGINLSSIKIGNFLIGSKNNGNLFIKKAVN